MSVLIGRAHSRYKLFPKGGRSSSGSSGPALAPFAAAQLQYLPLWPLLSDKHCTWLT